MSGGNGRPYGRTRRRLRAMLEALGYTNVTLHPAQGRERSDFRQDINRWNGFATTAAGISCSFYSWDTMTKCVRNGIVIDADGSPWSLDVSAKETP